MRGAGKRQVRAYRADSRYRALLDHCLGCQECRADTAKVCPEAGTLRSAWQRARGGETV